MIPKVAHFMWLPDFSQAPADQRENIVSWSKLNPDYKIVTWTYPEVRDFIGDHYKDFLEIWESLDKVIKQADLARLLIIHHYGGCYFDLDLVPNTPLDDFFSDGKIYNAHLTGNRTPHEPSVNYFDKSKATCFMSKEHRPIDQIGVGVANGIIIAEPKQDWILDFCNIQKFAYKGLVLDFVGTWALTRYIRAHIQELRSGGLCLLPPHYFLWEEAYYGRGPLDYTVCSHPAVNSWGDKSKPDWFRV